MFSLKKLGVKVKLIKSRYLSYFVVLAIISSFVRSNNPYFSLSMGQDNFFGQRSSCSNFYQPDTSCFKDPFSWAVSRQSEEIMTSIRIRNEQQAYQ